MKEAVYHGLVKLVLMDRSSAGVVLDFLWPHFLRFFGEVRSHLVFFSLKCLLNVMLLHFRFMVYNIKFKKLLLIHSYTL